MHKMWAQSGTRDNLVAILSKQFLYMYHVISSLQKQSLCVDTNHAEQRDKVEGTEQSVGSCKA